VHPRRPAHHPRAGGGHGDAELPRRRRRPGDLHRHRIPAAGLHHPRGRLGAGGVPGTVRGLARRGRRDPVQSEGAAMTGTIPARAGLTRTALTRTRRLVTALLATVMLATGCGLNNGGSVPLPVGPGPEGTVPALEGVRITVGGKDFTEGVIASYLVEFLLAAAGMEVSDMSSLAGSNSFRQALVTGQVDIGMEYTG